MSDSQRDSIPAIIAITGRLEAVRDFPNARRVAQWQLYCSNGHERVRNRLSGVDSLDLLNTLNADLTMFDPPRGATYTVYFSVPRRVDGIVSKDNFFETVFSGNAGLQRERAAFLRNSWNPFEHLLHWLEMDDIPDPWNDDPKVRDRIVETITARALPVLMNLWRSWTKDRMIASMLSIQGVPVEDDNRTEYRPGDLNRRILERLPLAMRRTIFPGYIPDLPEEVIDQLSTLRR